MQTFWKEVKEGKRISLAGRKNDYLTKKDTWDFAFLSSYLKGEE